MTAGAFTLLLGLVVDGGRVIDSRLASTRTAAQAARSGADALSAASVRNGKDEIAVATAINRAEKYLRDAGVTGFARVVGPTVTVTVTGRSTTVILSVIGIKSFPIEETQSAEAINQGAQP
ncbi:hypothetical protein [Nocardioides marmoriginsengisoli]|uniref:hypothetical protein n=1 Tax=Nocardioides marmoriginsengisoli TaxID=661483 RepID=UPI0011CDECDF|nr:hypothetical protein [Nocardioides marmoriginsengisoli]